MDWSDNGEQAAFRAEVRSFIEESLPQLYRDRIAASRSRGLEGDWQEDIVYGTDEAKVAVPVLLALLKSNDPGTRARACAASSACRACSAARIWLISLLIEDKSCCRDASWPSIEAFSAERSATSFAC